MGLSSAVDWWEEWQLRILVLGSQSVQWILFLSVSRRKSIISAPVRLLIWLVYIGSDAVAIYALAALFNRHKKPGNSVLEVVWAPILLMHLGGQDGITAYNMEDNELWKRHVLTAVSQLTVSIYVFCKSWRGGDKKLLQAAIMLFTIGGIRCLEKPFALQKASINNLVSSDEESHNKIISSLEDYVKIVGDFYAAHRVGVTEVGSSSLWSPYKPQEQVQVNKLFVDLVSPYSDRLGVTKAFLRLHGETAYELLQERLSNTFDLLYTKEKIAFFTRARRYVKGDSAPMLRFFRSTFIILPFAAIGLFHQSHREAYDDKDVKVTYTVLCCTAVMELFSYTGSYGSTFSGVVAQYSVLGYFARNKNYTKIMSILSFLKLKACIDQHWSMKSRKTTSDITILVHQQVKGWWEEHIRDAADYTKFNNHRGQWTIEQNGCSKIIGWSIKRSFDESVLLWHIATDLCFYQMGVRSGHYVSESAAGCREISNYMMYLLFVKPEMLMAGTRRNLFIEAYGELSTMLRSGEQPPVDKRTVAHTVLAKVDKLPSGHFVSWACDLAKSLLDLNDEKKMWKVIEGVWVEMLCYSASRCRGYLHAKSLGTGGELLTFVWLLWSHMGMETLAEKMQMQMPDEELPSEGETNSTGELADQVIEAASSPIDIIE